MRTLLYIISGWISVLQLHGGSGGSGGGGGGGLCWAWTTAPSYALFRPKLVPATTATFVESSRKPKKTLLSLSSPFPSSSSMSSSSTTTTTTTSLVSQQQLPVDYKDRGEELIRQAGASCGLDSSQIAIDWKQHGKIVVTVSSDNVYLSTSSSLDDVDDEDNDDDAVAAFNIGKDRKNFSIDSFDYDDDGDDPYFVADEWVEEFQSSSSDDDDDDDEEGEEFGEALDEEMVEYENDSFYEMEDPFPSSGGGVDVVLLARLINTALENDESGVGVKIAETHEIEVTTPGASEEIVGDVMWNAYQGFDVICQYLDDDKKQKKSQKSSKKNKNKDMTAGGDLPDEQEEEPEPVLKTMEGRLYDRDDEYTTINLKGRLKKISNDLVVSVKLPPVKKEKGAIF
ncbi:hypothetical protein ACA910_011448 [Epithemia clementina (nom. ined.)]